jgi:glyoxylase-like metal-dependent hydrolase (beta-lactamase superfamily II)
MKHAIGSLLVGLFVSVVSCSEATAQAVASNLSPSARQRAAANTPDAKAVVAAAQTSMGATNLRTIQFSGSGLTFTHGQALVRFGPLPRFTLKSFTYTADYMTPGSRVERVRTQLDPPRGGSPQPVIGEERTTTYLNGDFSWGLNASGAANRQPGGQGLDADVLEQRQIELWETPHGFLIAASKSAAPAVREQRIGGRRLRVVSFPRGRTRMDGYITDDNLVERVETWMAHPVLGDMSMEMTYANYRDWNGVKFPTRITERWGGEVVLDLTINDVKPNIAIDLAVPAAVRNTPVPPITTITANKLADGIYVIGGQNANTIAVEFKDFVVAIEGGTHQERSLAVIPEIRRLIPAKPIRYLVNTHAQYNDHAGGVRPYAAEGVTIITHKDNKKWFEEIAFRGTWTIEPDKLSQMKTTPRLETVDDSKEITDGTRKLVLYHMKGNSHDASMLMAYLPAEKWIIEADAYSTNASGAPLFGPSVPPPGAPPDFPRCCDARNLYDNVERLRLDVKTIVPIHGIPASWESFLEFLGKRRAEASASQSAVGSRR